MKNNFTISIMTDLQQASGHTIDRLISNSIDRGIKNHIFSVASVGIFHRRSGFTYLRTTGKLDPENTKLEGTLDSLFDLASLTKTFIAVLTFVLISQKVINLDDNIAHILPKSTLSIKDKGKITIAHLLSHSSGLPSSFDIYSTKEWVKGKDYLIHKLFQTPLENEPGKEFSYSCLGYILLGYILECILNQTLDQAISTFVLLPSGLNDIQYNPDRNCSTDIVRTAFTRPNRGVLLPGIVHDGTAFALGGVSGNAGLFGSPKSLLKFGELILGNWHGDCYPYMEKDLIHKMTMEYIATPSSRMSLGWMLGTKKSNSWSPFTSGSPYSTLAFGHTGFTGSSIWIDPAKELVVLILSNRTIFGTSEQQSIQFQSWRFRLQTVIKDWFDAIN